MEDPMNNTFKIRPIRNTEDYQAALGELEILMNAQPVTGSETFDQLEVLSLLIEKYESEQFPTDLPSAVDVLLFFMDQKNLKATDLAPYLGSKSRVSEVLSGKRHLTLEMIRSLEENLGIPAALLVKKSGDEKSESRQSLIAKISKKLMSSLKDLNYFSELGTELSDEEMVNTFFNESSSLNFSRAFARKTARIHPGTEEIALDIWQRRVALKASKIRLETTYSRNRLTNHTLRHIAQLSSNTEGPILVRNYLNTLGIILIIEPALPKTLLDGCAFLLNESVPVIGLTLRHDRLDNFWFTLLHELAHVKLHLFSGDNNVFFDELDEIKGQEISSIEKEADDLASESLIPSELWMTSPARNIPSKLAATSLAKAAGVDIAIVAGKIRYESSKWQYLNKVISDVSVRTMFNN